jgi:hypothetical protein
MQKLSIFVSSTCYDLSQLRADLNDFILSIGHTPVLSEFSTFPINPTKSTVDNCINAVNEHADILILIVGNRYGSQLETGKSITNIEFLTARNKGIPIYIFIKKDILSILPVWYNNQSADFSAVTDNPKIFNFINEVRNDSKLWSFEFDKAKDITQILNVQLSYLFKDCLRIKNRFDSEIEGFFQNKLSTKALKILFEKGDEFEIDFFSQVLIDELSKREEVKNDLEYKIFIRSVESAIGLEGMAEWFSKRSEVILQLIASLNSLISNAFPKYFALPGEPSDIKGLYYTAQTYARIFETLVLWALETASAHVDHEYDDLKDKLSKLSRKAIEQVWHFAFELSESINETKSRIASGEKNISVEMTLTIEIDENDLSEFYNELNLLKRTNGF